MQTVKEQGGNMKKAFKFLGLIITFVLSFVLISCGSDSTPKNDKEYQLSELVGTYSAERDTVSGSSVTYYVYTLVIDSDGNAKAVENKSTYESKRGGMSWDSDLFEGKVNLTKDNIKISSYSGYIQTINGKIIITLKSKFDIEFEKQ